MSQKEILDIITTHPGILQKEVIRRNNKTGKAGGGDYLMLLRLVRKKCVRREISGRTYALYPTGEGL